MLQVLADDRDEPFRCLVDGQLLRAPRHSFSTIN
jgi:hypothetical protein